MTSMVLLWSLRGLAGLLAVTAIAMVMNRLLRRPKEVPAYRFEDFLEDLKNPAMSVDEIIAKCGGTIQREWEERIGPAPATAPPGQIELPAISDGDRNEARQAWFNRAAVNTKLLKVVPPPLTPAPVPMIKAWVVNCKFCAPNNGAYLPPPYNRYNPCRWCGGKGLVMITGG